VVVEVTEEEVEEEEEAREEVGEEEEEATGGEEAAIAEASVAALRLRSAAEGAGAVAEASVAALRRSGAEGAAAAAAEEEVGFDEVKKMRTKNENKSLSAASIEVQFSSSFSCRVLSLSFSRRCSSDGTGGTSTALMEGTRRPRATMRG
jgi:hypothetical protein